MHLLALVTHPLHVWRCPCCPSISRFIGSLARICSLVSPRLLVVWLFMRICIVLSGRPILLGGEHLLLAHMQAPSLEKTKVVLPLNPAQYNIKISERVGAARIALPS